MRQRDVPLKFIYSMGVPTFPKAMPVPVTNIVPLQFMPKLVSKSALDGDSNSN